MTINFFVITNFVNKSILSQHNDASVGRGTYVEQVSPMLWGILIRQ